MNYMVLKRIKDYKLYGIKDFSIKKNHYILIFCYCDIKFVIS